MPSTEESTSKAVWACFTKAWAAVVPAPEIKVPAQVVETRPAADWRESWGKTAAATDAAPPLVPPPSAGRPDPPRSCRSGKRMSALATIFTSLPHSWAYPRCWLGALGAVAHSFAPAAVRTLVRHYRQKRRVHSMVP